MYIVCSDLEGVFTPEIWISVAGHTGIDELKLTTRDISDYNILMKRRLEILRQNNLTLHLIQHVISSLNPLPGAASFIAWLRKRAQLVVVSDTFVEFASPLMEKLGHPTLFCNHLTVDHLGNITDYNLRQENGKMKVVEALQNLNYRVIAVGDSYNDISMIRKADKGLLFKPPRKVTDDNSDLPVVHSYDELKDFILEYIDNGS
ncbi:MAG TPA: bifunctional phosphoserine phosphatase/homoserine phosphotransferase ThrH [Bacteroidales bacterium]|nr:bifunctional phosphoserine phosphatase/homoserine phosphotransferase ThrH [Bacteroidales bacterium]HPR11296.1 bifunctional phosphoserine phosphatase/homoserine phosphotransferase ThrH [Bacteroidales bacterium]